MLAQAYRWTLDDIRKLSYLQILLIQHAASHNRKVLDKRLEEKRKKGSTTPTEDLGDFGKPFSQLTSEELLSMASGEGAVRIIKTKKDDVGEE